MPNCCVCNEPTDIFCSSPFGAYSQAYCPSCLEKDIHPYSDITTTFWMCGATSLMDIGEGYHDTILATLKYHNKTIDDVLADVKIIDKNYEDHMKYDEGI